MAKGLINALLEKRLGRKEKAQKMGTLAKKSQEGQLSSFSGVFSVSDLSEEEKQALEEILLNHTLESEEYQQDLDALVQITSEVKAINNQAALLHGERIKRAHAILTRYQEGAFTAWLIEAYGNRQTPYNFWQYYEFRMQMPKNLHPNLEVMPRQAIYTLASRKGTFDEKLRLVENYQGESKQEMLELIRRTFPLEQGDKRRKNPIDKVFRLIDELERQMHTLKGSEKQKILERLEDLL